MTTVPVSCDDLVARYAGILEELSQCSPASRGSERWLGYAAYLCVLRPGSPRQVAQEVQAGGEALARHSSWYQGLMTPLRYAIAASIIHVGSDAEDFAAELDHLRAQLHECGLRQGSFSGWDAVTAVIIHLLHQGRPLTRLHLLRLQAIFTGMRQHHWWLTGPDDIPSCALLALRSEDPLALVGEADRLYQDLRAMSFAGGGNLHATTQLLLALNLPRVLALKRLHDLVAAMDARGQRILPEDYAEMVPLCLLGQDAGVIADTVAVIAHKCDRHALLNPLQGDLVVPINLAFLHLVRRAKAGSGEATAADRVEMLRRIHLNHAISLVGAMREIGTVNLALPEGNAAWDA